MAETLPCASIFLFFMVFQMFVGTSDSEEI